jgi:ABC-type spermidine/putrescine transport system permease subunit I
MALPPVVLTAVFIGVPILVSITYTLGHTGGANAAVSAVAEHEVSAHGALLTTRAYSQVLSSTQFVQDFVITIIVTVLSVVVVLALSWGIALYARFSAGKLGQILSSLAIVPLFIPVVIGSYGILQFWSYDGFIKTVAYHLGMPSFPSVSQTIAAVVIGEIWVSIPFGVLMVSSGLQGVPDSLFEAARDAGASVLQATLRVLVPLNLVPTVIAVCFTGIAILGSFTVPYLVGPTAPSMLGEQATLTFEAFSEPQQAEVMAMVLFGLSILVAVPYLWATYRSNRQSAETTIL